MAEKMTTCKACGKEIVKSAKICPNCGKKNGIPLWQKLSIGIVAVIVIAAIANTDDSSDSSDSSASNTQSASKVSEEKEKKIESVVISPVNLLNAYDENEVKADSTYKGKLLEVTGSVNDIGKDILDNPYITFSKGEYEVTDVQVYL